MVFQIHSRILFQNVISDNNIFYSSWKSKATFYEILNLKKDCNSKEIKDAYIKLSKLYHPDKTNNPEGSSHKKFLKISEAYNTLIKTDLRRIYDFQLTNPQPPQSAKMHNYDYDWSMYDNPFFYKSKNSNSNSSQKNAYYGMKGIKKQPNFVIAMICFIISVVGVSVQVLMVRNSLTLRRDKSKKETDENEILLNKIKESANLNGRELQIEHLRQRFEEIESSKGRR